MAINVQTRNKALDKLLSEKTTIYVSIPSHSPSPSDSLPNAVIKFGSATGGKTTNNNAIQIVAPQGTTIDKIYLSTTQLTNQTIGNEFARIELTGEDIETYETNGIYLINTIRVELN